MFIWPQLLIAGLFAAVVVLVFYLCVRLLVLMLLKRLGRRDRLTGTFLAHRWVKVVVLTVGAVGLACVAWGYFVEPYRVEVTRHELTTSKLSAGTTLKIVHLSDLHIDEEGPRELAIPGLVNGEKPDIILLTGDYVNNSTADTKDVFARLLGKLEAPLGIYAIAGNWDLFRGFQSLAVLREQGVLQMDGMSEVLLHEGDRIRITGLLHAQHVEGLRDDSTFHIGLHHTPDEIERMAGHVDLYLCGHTHGGQIRLPFFGALLTLSRFWKRYEMGRYEVGTTTLYVHRGIGMEGGGAPRVRFLSRPEIAVFEVTGTGQQAQTHKSQ